MRDDLGREPLVSQSIIRIRCPNLLCGRVLAIPGHARGRRVKCRACSTVMKVPQKRKDQPVTPKAAEEPGPDRAAA